MASGEFDGDARARAARVRADGSRDWAFVSELGLTRLILQVDICGIFGGAVTWGSWFRVKE